jgi:hypothetical protein
VTGVFWPRRLPGLSKETTNPAYAGAGNLQRRRGLGVGLGRVELPTSRLSAARTQRRPAPTVVTPTGHRSERQRAPAGAGSFVTGNGTGLSAYLNWALNGRGARARTTRVAPRRPAPE